MIEFFSRVPIGTRCLVSLVVGSVTLATSVAAQSVLPDRGNAVYELNETMDFVIESPVSGTATYTLRFDLDTTVILSGSVPASAGAPAKIPFSSAIPGFVLCDVSLNGAQLRTGAGFGVNQLGPSEAEPADFDDYWQTQLDSLAQIAIDPVPGPASSGSYSATYPINLAMVDGRRVYGYVSIPNPESSSGPFPAVLQLPAFGSSAIGPSVYAAEEGGAITMSISIHNGNPDANAYEPNDPSKRDEIYYRWAILAGVRAIDYLFTLPEFDGANLGVMGVSQGGGLSLVLAGLDSRVKALSTSNAALAEHPGYRHDRASGFPDYLKNNPGLDPNEVAIATSYYDAVHFAKRFEGPSLHNISFEDDVCPPATSWAAYNQLRGERTLLRTRDLGHSHPWNEHQIARLHFFRRFFGMAPANPWKDPLVWYGANVGPDRGVASGQALSLQATVDYEGVVNTSWPGSWEKVEGPGAVSFATPNARSTSASFGAEGTYVLRFVAQDESLAEQGQVHTLSDDLRIVVGDEIHADDIEAGTLFAWN